MGKIRSSDEPVQTTHPSSSEAWTRAGSRGFNGCVLRRRRSARKSPSHILSATFRVTLNARRQERTWLRARWGQSSPSAGKSRSSPTIVLARPATSALISSRKRRRRPCLLMTATSFATSPALTPKLPFDPIKSFTPIVQIAASELTLVVHPQLPVKSMREFIQLAKRRPGELLYARPATAVLSISAAELIKLETGIESFMCPTRASPAPRPHRRPRAGDGRGHTDGLAAGAGR